MRWTLWFSRGGRGGSSFDGFRCFKVPPRSRMLGRQRVVIIIYYTAQQQRRQRRTHRVVATLRGGGSTRSASSPSRRRHPFTEYATRPYALFGTASAVYQCTGDVVEKKERRSSPPPPPSSSSSSSSFVAVVARQLLRPPSSPVHNTGHPSTRPPQPSSCVGSRRQTLSRIATIRYRRRDRRRSVQSYRPC